MQNSSDLRVRIGLYQREKKSKGFDKDAVCAPSYDSTTEVKTRYFKSLKTSPWISIFLFFVAGIVDCRE